MTTDPAHDRHPDWSPDGDRVVFYSYRNGLADLYIRAADGSGRDEPLVTAASTLRDWSELVSRREHHRLPRSRSEDRSARALVRHAQRRAENTSFLPGAPGIAMPRISPDGRRIAYVSNESGRWEVYVRAFPAGTESWKISTGGGMWPKWSRHTDELFYFDGANHDGCDRPAAPSTASVPRPVFTAAQVGLAGSASDAFNPLF